MTKKQYEVSCLPEGQQTEDTENKREAICAKKDASYSNLFSVSTFLVSFLVDVAIALGFSSEHQSFITIIVAIVTILPCCFLYFKLKNECENMVQKRSGFVTAFLKLGTNLGYLNPIVLLFGAILSLSNSFLLNIFLLISLVILVLCTIIYSIRKR